jgi:hypothetical protein
MRTHEGATISDQKVVQYLSVYAHEHTEVPFLFREESHENIWWVKNNRVNLYLSVAASYYKPEPRIFWLVSRLWRISTNSILTLR